MEDVGELPLGSSLNATSTVATILDDLARSVMRVGVQQRVTYREIFVGMREVQIARGDIGSALVACPYFTLAQGAIPASEAGLLWTMSLADWDAAVEARPAQHRNPPAG
jgi:hypothetical protein